MRASLVPIFALIMALLISSKWGRGAGARISAATGAGLVDRAGGPGTSDSQSDIHRRGGRRHDLPGPGAATETAALRTPAANSVLAIKDGKSWVFADGLGTVQRPGMDRWHALCHSSTRNSRRFATPTTTAGPTSGPTWSPAWARRALSNRTSTTTSPPAFERVCRRLSLHRRGRQGHFAGGRQGRAQHHACGRRRDPGPARRHRARGVLDWRTKSAFDRPECHRRDLHRERRRRRQPLAGRTDASDRRRPLRISLPVPDRTLPRLAPHGRRGRRTRNSGRLL